MSTAPARPSIWKGKEKAAPDSQAPESYFNDLEPVITYRTILNCQSRRPGSVSLSTDLSKALRVISLCDCDAFYAGCEMVRLNIFDKPLVVLQWKLLIAVNYPARKYGITRMMPLKEAKERCPELIVVHVATYKEGEHEPGYWENPDTRTHKVSLDLYRRESIKTLQHAPLGLDTPLPPPPDTLWHEHSTIIPIDPSQEEAFNPKTWHDIALSIGAELMHKVRHQISEKLTYTTSAGIARNKFLAKLCASHRKPMGQSILRNAAIPNYLLPLDFQRIRFLGGKLGVALADGYDVSSVADLLCRRFGEESIWVYEVLRQVAAIYLKEKSALNKSMLAAKNLPEPITKLSDGYHWIRVLAAELALRLNEARETKLAMWPKTIVLHARNVLGDGRKSKQAPWPFVQDVTVEVVAAAADRLWRELIDPHAPLKVTGLSLGFTGIEGVESGLKSIDTFFRKPVSKRGADETDDPNPNAKTSDASITTSKNISNSSFVCSRCGHKASLAPSATRSDVERESALMLLKMEHDDFHVALELSKVPEIEADSDTVGVKPAEPKKKKRRKESPQGIAKFFTRPS
ncbi:DNA/RNA polymerase [Mycena amicta]|nr:DNA/RNA polymerase [Mycena amicta]